MGTASCESLLSPQLSSVLLRLGMYVPVLPLSLLLLRNATRLGLGPRPRDEGSGLESRRNTVQAFLDASTTGASTLCHARYVGRRAGAVAAASGCATSADDGKADDSESESTLPLGGEEAALTLELILVLARKPRSPERFTRPVVAAQHGRSHGTALHACHASPLGGNERRRLCRGCAYRAGFPIVRPDSLPMRPPSSKPEYVLVSVMLFDGIDFSAIESAIDMGEDSFIMDDAERNGERGGPSLQSPVVVLVGV